MKNNISIRFAPKIEPININIELNDEYFVRNSRVIKTIIEDVIYKIPASTIVDFDNIERFIYEINDKVTTGEKYAALITLYGLQNISTNKLMEIGTDIMMDVLQQKIVMKERK